MPDARVCENARNQFFYGQKKLTRKSGARARDSVALNHNE